MHRSPADLAREIAMVEQIALARAEAELVLDAYVDGLRDVFDRLKKSAAIAQELQANRDRNRG
jgi:hypothetical protein